MATILPVLSLTPKTDSLVDTITESFVFEGFEEPYEINFGKEQSAYKHVLIGGGRVIDMMGAGDPDITWSGYFTGFQAPLRARYLETLCKQGQPLTLRTNAFVKEVVITKFTFGQHEIWPIQYTLTLMVIEDKTSPVNFAIPGDLTITVLEYLFQAEAIATAIGNGSISGALAAAIAASQAAAPFDSASNEAIAAALSAAQNANSVVGTVIGDTENAIFGGGSSSVGSPNSIINYAVNPEQLILDGNDLIELDQLYTIQNLLNAYVIKNFLLIGQAQDARAETYINPNLYSVAVQFYGSVDYWPVLAKANNLTETQLTGTYTLLIPPLPSVNTGSILNPSISANIT
jgi:hypothetical protein